MSPIRKNFANQLNIYWQSLAELDNVPSSESSGSDRELKSHADSNNAVITRRGFLSLMGASLALAGLAGCRRPVEKIIPYVVAPDDTIPGVPQYYATTMPFGLSSYGLIVRSNDGRPTKIEGHPEHPSTKGATDFLTQASILNLYDPGRSKMVRQKGATQKYQDFVGFWRREYEKFLVNGGEGLAILSESFNSPTLSR